MSRTTAPLVSRLPSIGGIVSAMLTCSTAVADIGFGEEQFKLQLGGFLSDFDSNVKLSGPNGGTSVSLEDALGLDADQTTFRGELTWRFAPRHRVMLGYYSFKRDASDINDRSFVVDTEDGTYEFDAGTRIETEFDWTLIPISYGYSFYKTEQLEIAGTVGVHWFDTRIGYAGSAVVTPPGGSPSPVASAAEAETASGPLPVFGIRADYAITPKWYVGGHAQYFGLDYDDYSGRLSDFRIQTDYWLTDYIGAGLGYTWYNIDRSVDKGRYEAAAEYRYNGFEAYLQFRF